MNYEGRVVHRPQGNGTRDFPGVSPPGRATCALSATIERHNVRERRKRVGHNWIDASPWSN